MNKQYRQGDVLIEEINNLPNDAKETASNKPVILAWGEVTGHKHQIKSGAKEFNFGGDKFGNRILTITKPSANLVHEEHSTITLPKGNYRIIQQMEYQQEIRPVVD